MLGTPTAAITAVSRRRVHARGEGRASRSASVRARSKRHALPRVVFVVGPTTSGKTALGIRIAKLLNGEVINADARQVYRDVHIGTGKPSGKRVRKGSQSVYMVEGVPHYLMDAIPVKDAYSVAEWRDAAMKAIASITRRKKLPIVVGGTGLYVSALIDNYQFPRVEPQPEMRKALESKELEELVKALLVADPGAVAVVDLKNKRRVIRALEVVTFSGQKFSESRTKAEPLVESFQVGIKWPVDVLYNRVSDNVDSMFDEGIADEVRGLLRQNVPPDAPAMTSIGYQDIVRYLKGDISLDDAIRLLKQRTRQYTKRQWTWFKRDARIHWAANEDEAVKLVEEWVK